MEGRESRSVGRSYLATIAATTSGRVSGRPEVDEPTLDDDDVFAIGQVDRHPVVVRKVASLHGRPFAVDEQHVLDNDCPDGRHVWRAVQRRRGEPVARDGRSRSATADHETA